MKGARSSTSSSVGRNGEELSTRERQRRDTRRRIFDAAAAEISEKGLAGMSVVAVARAAGVSRQTFYDHFPTPESLVEEALDRYRLRVEDRLHAAGIDDQPLEPMLHAVVDAMFAALDRSGGRMRQEISALLSRRAPAGHRDDEPMFAAVVAAVRRAQLCGEVSSHRPPGDVARLALTAISGFVRIENESSRRRISRAHDLVALLVAGLRSEAAEDRGEERSVGFAAGAVRRRG